VRAVLYNNGNTMRESPRYPLIAFRCDLDFDARLKETAAAQGISKSALIKHYCEQGLQKQSLDDQAAA
jgi:hypothetical protein